MLMRAIEEDRYTMVMDWKTHHSKCVSYLPNSSVSLTPNQNSTIFSRITYRKIILKGKGQSRKHFGKRKIEGGSAFPNIKAN
jgi:hypothetical protein